MTISATNWGSCQWSSVRKASQRILAQVLFFTLVFSVLVVPARLIAQTSTTPQNTAATPRSLHQSKLQAERRAEIRQQKIDNPEAEDGENVYRHSDRVKKLAGAFGLSVETTSRLFEVINFVLLVILIVWGIWKVIPRLFPQLTFRARTERIQREIEQARIATEDANRRLASVEERLSRLDHDIDAIRAQAEQETAVEEKRLRAALEQEKQTILDSATQDISAATKNAQSLLKKLAADLVIEQAKRQIAISPETDQTLVAGFLKDVSENHPRGGVN
jgi:F-type H+-transporting ATPase subunit b